MRGQDTNQTNMFSYLSLETRIPQDHPLRFVRELVNEVLKEMSRKFSAMYSHTGRPSIAPEKLLRALLLQVLYSIRSERQLMEQLDYNLLFRWFVGLSIDDPVWDATVYTKNRDRLLAGDIAQRFFDEVLQRAEKDGLVSDEHFTVDGTLLEANASLKSFKAKDGDDDPKNEGGSNPTVNFHRQKRSNKTHISKTDPDARLAKKGAGKEARLSYAGHALMENRNGLVVNTEVTFATGTAEREAAVSMAEEIPGEKRVTLGADKLYDCKDFVEDLRDMKVTPHVAQNESRRRSSAIDQRTTRHDGYKTSQKKRKRVEEIFGWMKTVGGMRKLRHRGLETIRWMFCFTAAVFNLVRIRNLAAPT